VSAQTRQRVAAAIARLGYDPSPSARALSRGRSQTIEVVVPLLTRYFYFEVLRGVLAAVANSDYCLNVRVIERPADRDAAFADAGRRGRPDGLLILRVPPTDDLVARLGRAGVPIMLVDAVHPALPGVGIDHGANAILMTEHLLGLGHRRIALVDRGDDPFDAAVLRSRRQGYRVALERAGVAHRAEYEHVAEWSADGGAAALDALLALPEPPTAVFAGSDTQAIGVLDRARQHGVAVPGELAVCGYGDVELARYLGLTTVRVPMRTMGERAIASLLEAIDGRPTPPVTAVLPAELVVRATCGAPAAGA
jgi:LacI family transcriptional regulator